MQTSKMDRKKSQQSLGRKPAGISLTGCVNSPETLQRKRVAQPRQRRESSSNKFPAAEPLLGPAPQDFPQERWNFGRAPRGVPGPCRDTVLPNSSTAGTPGTPVLPRLGSGSPPHSAWRELPLAIASPLPPVTGAPVLGTGGQAARRTLCESRWGSSAVLPTCWDGVIYLHRYLAFLTFSEESRWGSPHLQNLINAKRYQGMRLLWEAEQMR